MVEHGRQRELSCCWRVDWHDAEEITGKSTYCRVNDLIIIPHDYVYVYIYVYIKVQLVVLPHFQSKISCLSSVCLVK